MSCDPFVFVKNFNERLEDLSNILGNTMTASDVRDVWISYTELCIEPTGWQAMWKIPREICEDFKMSYPCIVVVCVESVNPLDLSCLVSINKVEDDSIQLPKNINDVPLVQLYPLKEQDNSLALPKLDETAELVDSLRFFYNHLWMPWDLVCDSDDDISWIETHLEGRLKLYFLMVQRSLPGEVAYQVHRLVAEGKQAQKRLEELQEEAEREMNTESPARVLSLVTLHNKLCDLRNRYRIYETPHLLEALIQTKFNPENAQGAEKKEFLVLSETTPERLMAIGERTKLFLSPETKISVVGTLQDGLGRATSRSRVLLAEGLHHFHDLCALEKGGSIEGLGQGVIVTDDPIGSCSMNIVDSTLSLCNLTLRLTSSLNTIKVRPGAECRLEGVTLKGSPVIDGLDVYSSATLTALNCLFTGYSTALTCDSKSSVRLVNCTFADNKVAMELKEGASIVMENCNFSGSKTYAIQVVVPRPLPTEETQVKNMSSITNLQEANTTFNGNKKDLHFESNNETPINQGSPNIMDTI